MPKTDKENPPPSFKPDEPAVAVKPANVHGFHLGEHWSIVGITGSGKSYFAKRLLEYLRRQYPGTKRYILDSTDDPDMERDVTAPLVVTGNRVPDLIRDSTFTQIWKPDTDDPKAYDAWFNKIGYAREPAIVFVDEIASLSAYGREPPDGYIKLLKLGRKHGITVMSLTQEIARVPPSLFRQMKHLVLFHLNNETYDQRMARGYLSLDAYVPPKDRYGFYYRRTDGNYPHREFPSTQTFFSKL